MTRILGVPPIRRIPEAPSNIVATGLLAFCMTNPFISLGVVALMVTAAGGAYYYLSGDVKDVVPKAKVDTINKADEESRRDAMAALENQYKTLVDKRDRLAAGFFAEQQKRNAEIEKLKQQLSSMSPSPSNNTTN